MELDLDVLQYANIKLGGEVHKVKLPSVLDVHEFENNIKKNATDADTLVGIYSEYFTKLGLREEVAKGLNMYQFSKLHSALSGLDEKK